MNEDSDQKRAIEKPDSRGVESAFDLESESPDDRTEQLLLYVEDDAAHWDDAARECEHAARNDSPGKAPTWHLLSAVYRERAKNHRELVSRLRSHSAAA